MTTTSATIRTALRDELNLTSKDVSVTTDHGSFTVQVLREAVDFDAVNRVAGSFARVRYDEHTGCILRGGNTFVSVRAYKPMDAVEMTVRKTGDSARVKMYGQTPAGWFERGFANAEKATNHASRKGWKVAA